MAAALSTTTRSIAMISSRVCPISSSNISNRCNLMSRRYLSSNSTGSSSATTVIQNLAIFAVAGGLGYGTMTLFNSSNGGNNDGPTSPQAPVTSRVYFDINVQNQPLGRIVITPHLDNRHVVFGVVESGYEVVKEIESFGTRSGSPQAKIVISDCGILEDDDKTTEKKGEEAKS